MTVEIINTNQDGEGIPYYGQTDVLPSWPNTVRDNEFWSQAARELGTDAGLSRIALRAQEIKRRANMPAEDEMEHARRLA